jgi:hypothetical protein
VEPRRREKNPVFLKLYHSAVSRKKEKPQERLMLSRGRKKP